MSITACNEMPLGRRGMKRIEEGRVVVEYTRVFQVETNDVQDGPKTIRTYEDIPDIGDPYPDHTAAKCYSVEPVPRTRLVWDVTCIYRVGGGFWDSRYSEDPTDADPDIEFDEVVYSEVAEFAYQVGDTYGNPTYPITNSARQQFDTPLTQEKSHLLIVIKQNQRTFSPYWAMLYKNTMNNAAITIAGLTINAYCGWMRRFVGTKAWDENGDPFWQVTYEIEIDPETHYRKVLDQGIYQVTGGTPQGTIPDSAGNPVMEPVLLDGNGAPLARGATPVWLWFQLLWAVSWAPLALPSGM